MVGEGVACAERSTLFLLPRTFSSKKSTAVVSTVSEEQELEAIDDFFASAITRSSTEPPQGARNISNGSDDPYLVHYKDRHSADVVNAKDQAQGRRPALGRKRAHFSFNPNLNDSHLTVDIKSNVDHIEDPDELFLVFENIECAKKELKKQIGEVAIDSSPNIQWTATRKRRPGILGRKASYKHHFPEHNVTAETFVLSQEENQTSSLSKIGNNADSCSSSQQVTQPGKQPEIETYGSNLLDLSGREGFIADKEKEVDKLLDTLLHCFEDLDKGGEIDFLQERLQIKSTNLDKICLPPLDGIKTHGNTVMDSKMAAENFDGSLTIRVSPSVANTPLAAISVLRRRISQIDPLKDPFSMLVPFSNEKPSPEISSPDEGSKEGTLSPPFYVEQPDMTGSKVLSASGSEHPSKVRSKSNHKRKLHSLILEADTTPVGIASGHLEDSCCQTNEIADHSAGNVYELGITNDVGSTSFNTSTEDNASFHDMTSGVTSKEADLGDKELPLGTLGGGNMGASAGLFDSGTPSDSVLDATTHTSSLRINSTVENKVDDDHEVPALGGQDESSNKVATHIPMDGPPGSHFQSNESSNKAAAHTPMDGPPGNSTISPEHNKGNQTGLTASTNVPVEPEAPLKRQNRQGHDLRRHSLAGAGMAWQCGVRRSTRIKMKPLEFWRGERPLYARIHDSLPTLVGLKYASPAEAGQKKKQVLKVKSYVSEEYAGLVQKIALH